MLLSLDSISYCHPGAAAPALDGISAVFPDGWTGIIGDNGCGKTTLAKIAAGLLAPDAGTVSPRLVSAYCPQDSSAVPDDLQDFALDWGADAVAARTLLRIQDEWLWDYGNLSGGQQKRIQIACALRRRPDVLVMDEPTNDLDAPTRAIVGEALAAFEGVGLLISHDRVLLDALVQQCLVFEGGRAAMRPGGYSQVRAQSEADRCAQIAARETVKHELSRLQGEARRRRCEADRSQARLSGRGNAKGDSDRRERLGRARLTGKDAAAGRASAAMGKRVQDARRQLDSLAVTKRYEPGLAGFGEAARARTVIHAPATTLQRGDFTLAVPELWVGPTDRIAITGPNGAGKSTLIDYLAEQSGPGIRIARLPQSVGEGRRREALEGLRALDAAQAGRVLALVARLNSDPDRLRDGADLSPGELRKLMLAQQLAANPHLLILDEPTNHLDLGSIEVLQVLLAGFPGALVLATHDEVLAKTACDVRWAVGEGQVAQQL